MKKTKGSLTRKTITVRGKGKTYQRSVMVNAQASAAPARKAGKAKKSDYQKGAAMASAKTGAKVGFVSGLIGAHRQYGGSLGSAVISHKLAHSNRGQAGVHGKNLWQKAKNFVATDLGHGVGHAAGAAIHEAVRGGIKNMKDRRAARRAQGR